MLANESVEYAVDRVAFWGIAFGAVLIVALAIDHLRKG